MALLMTLGWEFTGLEPESYYDYNPLEVFYLPIESRVNAAGFLRESHRHTPAAHVPHVQ